jgi:starch synthase
MRIVLASSEIAPFAKTGGLGDVCGALPRYLHAAGHDVRAFLPWYGNLKESGQRFHPVAFAREVPVEIAGRRIPFTLWETTLPGTEVPVYLVRCPTFFGRNATYSADGDEHLRFAYLSRATLEACQRMGFAPDIYHCHDWHTALVPLYLKTAYAWDQRLFGRTRTVLTIHNVGYQGTVGADAVESLGLGPWRGLLHQDDLARDRLSFLKHGILYADALTTVSRTHAREMLTPEYGMGLDASLRARGNSFVGIVNGIDTDIWSPETDKRLPFRYSASDLSGKARNRRHLLESMGLPAEGTAPVFGIVSRLAYQKGLDLAMDVLPKLLRQTDARLVVLGSGEPRYEKFFQDAEREFPRQVRFRNAYDEDLAHRIEAGTDVFLMPSVYEPCGLNQMYSLRYGTIPVVRKTGGLADTVEAWDPSTGRGNGFVFEHLTATGLEWAVSRALEAWRDPAQWSRIVRNAMAADWSWQRQIREYESVYARVASGSP